MSIPDHARANFQRLFRAAENGDLALVKCSAATAHFFVPPAQAFPLTPKLHQSYSSGAVDGGASSPLHG